MTATCALFDDLGCIHRGNLRCRITVKMKDVVACCDAEVSEMHGPTFFTGRDGSNPPSSLIIDKQGLRKAFAM